MIGSWVSSIVIFYCSVSHIPASSAWPSIPKMRYRLFSFSWLHLRNIIPWDIPVLAVKSRVCFFRTVRVLITDLVFRSGQRRIRLACSFDSRFGSIQLFLIVLFLPIFWALTAVRCCFWTSSLHSAVVGWEFACVWKASVWEPHLWSIKLLALDSEISEISLEILKIGLTKTFQQHGWRSKWKIYSENQV